MLFIIRFYYLLHKLVAENHSVSKLLATLYISSEAGLIGRNFADWWDVGKKWPCRSYGGMAPVVPTKGTENGIFVKYTHEYTTHRFGHFRSPILPEFARTREFGRGWIL